MKPDLYEVEFLPLERRLQPRRSPTADTNPTHIERRLNDRRALMPDEAIPELASDHRDARHAA